MVLQGDYERPILACPICVARQRRRKGGSIGARGDEFSGRIKKPDIRSAVVTVAPDPVSLLQSGGVLHTHDPKRTWQQLGDYKVPF
jgi:hypothetical protein